MHHGVRIMDASLVFAAVNARKFISDRFLPDKAIDLIDEAASRLKMQMESKPDLIEKLAREVMMMRIEQEALRREPDISNEKRRAEVPAKRCLWLAGCTLMEC